MTTDTKIKVIKQIRDILDDLACNPSDFDLQKTAVEIYQISVDAYRDLVAWLSSFDTLADAMKACQSNKDICPQCGADKKVYLDTMGEECWHGHGGIK